MAVSFLKRWSQKREELQNAQATAFLHGQERFQSLLECERMRADRSRSKFSLAVFTFSEDFDGRHRLRKFAEHLEPRIRATDHPGAMGPNKIGVILWDTGEVGAWKFIDGVTTAPNAPQVNRCEVFVYPTYEAPSDPNDSNTGGRITVEMAGLLDAVSRDSGERRPAKSLDALFVRPLPVWKRAIDIIGAGFGLLLLSPLLATVAIAIKLTSRGPVLFTQLRDGLGGRQFTIYKFRTMRVNAEALKAALRSQSEQDGPAFKLQRDPRITRLGRWLRKSCVDELPQLWNVLKGDMTLVGPRPLDVKESQYIDGWKRRRLEVTPGLTCIWQVHGKSKVSFVEWMRMDLRYMRARSFLRDMRLVYETLVAVVLHKASH